jgi:hypothetical protein
LYGIATCNFQAEHPTTLLPHQSAGKLLDLLSSANVQHAGFGTNANAAAEPERQSGSTS